MQPWCGNGIDLQCVESNGAKTLKNGPKTPPQGGAQGENNGGGGGKAPRQQHQQPPLTSPPPTREREAHPKRGGRKGATPREHRRGGGGGGGGGAIKGGGANQRKKPHPDKGKARQRMNLVDGHGMMHLLLECSSDSIIAEYRLLHELALLLSKNRVVNPEFEDHSTHSVEPHRKSTRYTRVVRRVYLGIAGGCRRTFDGKNTRRGLHA